MTLTIRGATVVTSLDPPNVVPNTEVRIDGGRVISVGDGGAAASGEVLDATGCLVIPGNVCAHHHLYSSLARGMPYRLDPPTNFIEMLRRVWWRLDLAIDGDDAWLSAWSGGADAVLAGTTTIVDHHASPNAIERSLTSVASALAETGARCVVCYELTDRDGADRVAEGIEEHRRFAKEANAMSAVMVGAHASFTLSDATLASCVELAAELDTGIHIHAAEDAADETDAAARTGRRVIARLADAGALTDRTLLAHCIHVDAREASLIRDSGAFVAHNARSNMDNRVGHAPLAALGGNVALGTDGIDGDLFAESKAAYWRAREDDGSVQPSWILERLSASARLAAAASGEPTLGRIESGAPADLVCLDYSPPTPIAADNLAGHWLYGISAADVRDVVVNGEIVVRDRGLTRTDEAAQRARARAAAERLWERMDAIGEHPFEPAGTH